jgi:ATP-independent RNA helicase DbpA
MTLILRNHDNRRMTNTTSLAFNTLPLNPATLDNLQQLGYLSMTPIQAASLPTALAGKDLIAQAQTGSGKTAAFGLALLERLNPRRFAVQALVLCPTRELADQVAVEVRRLARALDTSRWSPCAAAWRCAVSARHWKTAHTLWSARPGA